ncbi:unnamed protein product [Absidia cylindrospora]
MSQIKNSLTDAMHRFSKPSGNQGKKKQPTSGTRKFKLPAMPSASGRRQQQPKKKDNVETKFFIRRPPHQRSKPHQNETSSKWGIFRGLSNKAHHPSPSFHLRKAVRWASLSKKKNPATGKPKVASKPSLLRFRQR